MLNFAGVKPESAIKFIDDFVRHDKKPAALIHAAIGVRVEGEMSSDLVKNALAEVAFCDAFCKLPGVIRTAVNERLNTEDVLDDSLEPPIYDLLAQIRSDDAMFLDTETRLVVG